jgi:hypothetical protein
VLGCNGACRTRQNLTPPPAPSPARPPELAASRIVGVWRLTVNGTGGSLAAFWPGGLVETTDPAMGVWRPRISGPGDVEGTWDIPLVDLSVTYVIAVDRDSFTGTGVAFDTRPGAKLNPITLAGTRVTIDPAVLAQVTPPRTS